MNSTIILIGPLGAGKTTVGHLLAKLVIYAKDKTPEQSCDEIVQKLV